MRICILAALLMSASPAFAWSDLDRMQMATQLGSVLAAERFCDMSYNQDSIGAYIEANIPADDMGFAPMLDTMIGGATFEQKSMEQSQKTAHCTQMRRVAKSFGFID